MLAKATASCPANRALLTMSATFARTERPAVISAMRARSHGVRARALDLGGGSVRDRPVRRPRARRQEGRRPLRETGTQNSTPDPRPRPKWVATSLAAAATSGTEAGAGMPLSRDQECGHLRSADGHNRDAARLEVLECGRHVRGSLGAGADDGDRRPSELLEVG